MLANRFVNRDFPLADPKARHQIQRVVVSAVGCAEARHGDAEDVRARQMEHVHRLARRQQRKRRIQSAGDANNDLPARDGQATRQRRRLHRQNLRAPQLPGRLVRRDERVLADAVIRRCVVRQQRVFHRSQNIRRLLPHGAHLRRAVREAALLHAVGADAVDVNIRRHQVIVRKIPLAFPDDRATGGNHAMPGKHKVGGRFAHARRNVHIPALAARALLADELLAVLALAQQLIAGGQVQDDFRAFNGQHRARRQRRPQILAQLDAEAHAVLHFKYCLTADICFQPRNGDRCIPARITRLKPALLIEFAVIGQERFRHRTDDFAFVQHHRAVIQCALNFQRRTDDRKDSLRHFVL